MCEDDDYYEVDDDTCEGCGRSELDDGQCPMCCSNGGCYAPGTEECDFCPSSDECMEIIGSIHDEKKEG